MERDVNERLSLKRISWAVKIIPFHDEEQKNCALDLLIML